MAHDVFLSHAAADRAAALAVLDGLERAGIRCWIAPRDVPAIADGRASQQATASRRPSLSSRVIKKLRATMPGEVCLVSGHAGQLSSRVRSRVLEMAFSHRCP